MTSTIADWRVNYERHTRSGRSSWREQVSGADEQPAAFDELVIRAAGIHIEVMYDGADPDDEGWAYLDVHIGELHLAVHVNAAGERSIRRLDGKFVDDKLMEEGR